MTMMYFSMNIKNIDFSKLKKNWLTTWSLTRKVPEINFRTNYDALNLAESCGLNIETLLSLKSRLGFV